MPAAESAPFGEPDALARPICVVSSTYCRLTRDYAKVPVRQRRGRRRHRQAVAAAPNSSVSISAWLAAV